MDIWVLDDTLRISVFYDEEDCKFKDNICVSIYESCPEDEKIFIADETNIFLKRREAQYLIEALTQAVQKSADR